jgi:F-type H+-transporting ATPase subunit b
MKSFITTLLVLLPVLAFANEHGAVHEVTVPKVVLFQFINVAILVAGLIYFTKDAAIAFFSSRKSVYLEAAQKSAFAREQAEKEFIDIKHKLANLDATRTDSLNKAQAHAEDMKKQIIDEANQVSKRIRDDAELTAKLEIQRAQKELREQLLQDSLTAARTLLTKDISSTDQQKLQKEFINNIEVMG